MTILNSNQLLVTIQQSINKVIKPTSRQRLLTRSSLEQPVTLDEYVYALLLNNLPPSSRHRR